MIVFLFFFSSNIRVTSCSESSKLVVGQVGDTVNLPCKYDINNNGLLNVCWGRHQSWLSCENTVISSYGLQVTYRESNRFSLASGLEQGDVSLTIKAAQKRDAGIATSVADVKDATNNYMYEAVAVVHTEDTMATFVINTVRGGAIVFIPGLIITLLFSK
ncbi:hepatitis A virus cellular receptor 1 homolog [Cyprinus carpio]|uniref:Hepatitis A virus cellular receptor 1 homolog n=1 Tax=Cyprinus carpio TaxID=7962 RepID=A0A9Q9VLV7_CYPCA|nr:hepatitis A virus cellular receptor 1 homolog [Cyprinus carpio]